MPDSSRHLTPVRACVRACVHVCMYKFSSVGKQEQTELIQRESSLSSDKFNSIVEKERNGTFPA